MKHTQNIFVLILVLAIIAACSTKKDALINRKFQALTTKYNVLFNGKQALEQGVKGIADTHQDNFWKRLPIEPITFDESEIVGPKFENFDEDFEDNQLDANGPFDRAEEKAVKAVQKHSMNFNGYEKNSQIDDAYLLLGKARYYTQRFIPAIDAFNYIIANYPNANLNYETRIWRAKSNVRLGNEKTAIESMKLLMKVVDEKENVPKRIQEQAHTAMAIAYSETDTIQKVIEHLTKATQTFYNREQTARNLFVLGQIYNDLNRKDSAKMVFSKLAKARKAPDKYRIHANIEMAKIASSDSTGVLLIKRLKKLIKNSDNRTYYDELYYQLGTLYEGNGNINKALDYYSKSLRARSNNDYQKTYTYERLGNLHFKKLDYITAGSYYDSVLKVVPKEFVNEKRIRRIKRKNKGLVKLKKFEDVVKTNDSILNLVDMTIEERTAYFNKYIEKLKEEDELRKQKLANAQNFGGISSGGFITDKKKRGKWYFYNNQIKQFGFTEFQRNWGNRPLQDNWRWSDLIKSNKTEEEGEKSIEDKQKERYDVQTYLKNIPTDSKEIQKLTADRNDALYQLGLSYKEQFKNNDLAIVNLERLNSVNTNKELELPINYHLYQLYSEIDKNKSLEKKDFILTNYPFSKYAEIINTPDKKIEEVKQEDEIVKKYKEFYCLYKEGEYEKVVEGVNSYSQNVDKSGLIPKFALLKALSLGKYESKENYIKALDFVAFSYANTEEGKKAKEIIKLLKK